MSSYALLCLAKLRERAGDRAEVLYRQASDLGSGPLPLNGMAM